jgi:hypothetical protein
MPSDHPFQQLFETFGKLPAAHSESVNQAAREKVKDWLNVALEKPGHCILLKAPRAGHGKTHLLTRLQHELGGTHEFIPLLAIGGSRIDASTVLDDTLRRLVRGLPAAGGLTVLDLVARRLFSASLQPLVNSGEVPCQDREGALVALRSRPIETFDFHHSGAVTAHWARENFELLGPRLALELSQRGGFPLREVSFWVDAMFNFSATPIDNPGRVRALAAKVFDGPGAEASAHERLVALLGLLSTLLRVVLVADELEGFSLDETAALRFASFIGSLRQSVDRADVILSVNQDVWGSAFLPRLSGGLADRLSEVTVELTPLDREGMIAVIESRSPGQGRKILDTLDPKSIPTHARGIIKEAAGSSGNGGEDVLQGEDVPAVSEPTAEAVKLPEPEIKAPVLEPPVEPITAPSPDFAAPPKPDFTTSPNPVEESPAEAPTRFSPEAAIAAFKAFPDSSEAPVEVEQQPSAPPSAPIAESQWPAPDALQSSGFAPAIAAADTELPVPESPQETALPAPSQACNPIESNTEAPEMDSSFTIDEPAAAAEAAVQAFQADPAPSKPEAELAPEPSSDGSTDRVDDLLRQFRERYGKS